MNIVLKNKNHKVIEELEIDILQTIMGEQSIEEVQDKLNNIYYNKIIIDITCIKNYRDSETSINFLRGFDPLKIIILITPGEFTNYNVLLGKLVENGYYNFTKDAEGINKLLANPNSYDDVKTFVNTSDISTLNPLNVDL
jgi:uncharacterized protein YkvS